ncbi:MAG: PIN domain nuclease [Planctomycetota bacterium]|nr:MAG: PIN domain nuclease [Planctomycetota bacterium]
MILLDTNILVRIANPADPQCQAALDAIDTAIQRRHVPCIVPQVIYEFWVVATRTAPSNGLGLTTDSADECVAKYLQKFCLLNDDAGLFADWRAIVAQHAILGKRAHDARLVAAMLSASSRGSTSRRGAALPRSIALKCGLLSAA